MKKISLFIVVLVMCVQSVYACTQEEKNVMARVKREMSMLPPLIREAMAAAQEGQQGVYRMKYSVLLNDINLWVKSIDICLDEPRRLPLEDDEKKQ